MSGVPRSRRTHRSTIHPLILSLMCLVHITGCPRTVRVSFSLACHSQRYRWFDLLNGRSKDTDYCKYSSIVRAPLSVLSTLKSHLRETLQSFHLSFRLSVYEEVTAEPVVRSSWNSYVQTPFYRNGQSTCGMLYEKVRFLLAFQNDNCLFKNRGCSFIIFKINPLVESFIRIYRFSLGGI